MSKKQYLPCRESVLKQIKELKKQFHDTITIQNFYEDKSFFNRYVKRKYENPEGLVIIKVKSEISLKMSIACKKLDGCLNPRKIFVRKEIRVGFSTVL